MKNVTVLYIDDDHEDIEIFLDAVREIFPPAICLTAKDGEEAVLMIDSLTVAPDIIFLDINMPKMNGKECLSFLRKNQTTAEIPIIIYSTSNNPKEVTECMSLGATEFLAKPSSYHLLCESLEKILTSHC